MNNLKDYVLDGGMDKDIEKWDKTSKPIAWAIIWFAVGYFTFGFVRILWN